jgi:exonuclease SbcC
MPPLILDEPTAHLDAGHIERIDGVVSRMREIGVEQTIVVSHTDELIDAADHRIEVTQRAATNRSEAHAESDLLV